MPRLRTGATTGILTPARWAARYGGASGNQRRLGLGSFLGAYCRYYTIPLYGLLLLAAAITAVLLPSRPIDVVLTVAGVIVGFPFAEWILHRFVLHCPFLYRVPLAASFWKRVHYDHHMDSRRLDVLFAAPMIAVPAVAVLTVPLPALLAGPGAAAAGFAAGMAMFLTYEFFHCAAHLPFDTGSRMLRRLRRHHLLHHHHSERGNYGIASDWVDRLFGQRYRSTDERPPSPTVRNLGYTAERAQRYPHVARLTASRASEDSVHGR